MKRELGIYWKLCMNCPKTTKDNISLEDFEGEKSVKYRGDNGWQMTPKA